MNLLARVAAALDDASIAFALIGASALAVHGVSRSTLDVDLLTTDPRVLDPATWTSWPPGVTIDIRKGDASDPLAGVVRIRTAGERDVDVMVGRGAWQSDILSRAVAVSIGDRAIPVAQPADLILLKLYAGGAQDCWDIEQLLASGSDESLAHDVEGRIAGLPLRSRDLWIRMRAGH